MLVAAFVPGLLYNANIVRVTLIHNPGAGDDDHPDGEALRALIERAGHAVFYQSCREGAWSAALDRPADIVAVAGGDGTVGRVAKKLIGRAVPVAPLPLGTANNISKTLGLDARSLEEIVAGWSGAQPITFDVGVANGPWGSRYFIEAAGVGLFACTIPVADESRHLASLQTTDAKVSYAIAMLRERLERCDPHWLDMTLDGERLSGEYVLFEAMNMEFVGPNLYLAPQVDPDDGRLDVVLVAASEREKLHASLARWQDGELEPPALARRRAASIELEWNGFELHFDDEAWPTAEHERPPALTRIELKAEREALRFLAV